MNQTNFVYAAIVFLLLFGSSQVSAKDEIRTERVKLKKGADGAVIKNRIKGSETVDYLLGARAGQIMRVTLQTSNGANYFNVLPPGSNAAIAIGATLGNEWIGTLPVDGDYTVRVYLMRSAARRNETANYTLSVGITGRADAKVAGTPYHATGTVPCSVGTDPKGSAKCSFGVIRSTPGHAEVHLASPGYDVTLHKDRLRVLNFAGATVTSPDPKDRVTFKKQGDDWLIGVNDFYYYIIPEAVIDGG
ncbi:MAG: hypothetical protein V2I56_07265 [Desulfobacteraceae bacterium]|jgi:hypothetical protein|nr:hypothetical protein [Desulfobacteraceae bacterium]